MRRCGYGHTAIMLSFVSGNVIRTFMFPADSVYLFRHRMKSKFYSSSQKTGEISAVLILSPRSSSTISPFCFSIHTYPYLLPACSIRSEAASSNNFPLRINTAKLYNIVLSMFHFISQNAFGLFKFPFTVVSQVVVQHILKSLVDIFLRIAVMRNRNRHDNRHTC